MILYCIVMLYGGLEDSSDSEGEEKEDFIKIILQFDDWLFFKLDNEVGIKQMYKIYVLFIVVYRRLLYFVL